MSILVSKCKASYDKFSKELYTEVSENLRLIPDEDFNEDDVESYKKVLCAVYVRTDTDNLVLLLRKDKFAGIFDIPEPVSNIGLYDNILIDSGLVNGKNLLDLVFSCKSQEALQRLVLKSTCYPVGAVESRRKYITVFNVIISSEVLRDKEIVLNEGFYFRPIETLSVQDSLQKEISESLVIVKSKETKL